MAQEQCVWIVVAGQAKARAFEARTRTEPCREVLQINNPVGKLRERDLNTDRPGRASHPAGRRRSGLTTQRSAKEHLLTKFADEIGAQLSDLRRRGRFNRLMVVADPQTLGRLRSAFSAYRNLDIIAESSRDMLNVPERTLGAELLDLIPRSAFGAPITALVKTPARGHVRRPDKGTTKSSAKRRSSRRPARLATQR